MHSDQTKFPQTINFAVWNILISEEKISILPIITMGQEKSEDLENNDFVKDEQNKNSVERGEVVEPHVGMEFDSEEDAKRFYASYARQVGFVVRSMQSRSRTEADGRTLVSRLGCNKQGYSPNKAKGKDEPDQKPTAGQTAREGCNAKIMLKLDKSGKWVVTKFIKNHNHPLVSNHDVQTKVHEKEKKIQELSRELQRQEEIYAAYREKLINLLANVEKQAEHLSSKVLAVVQTVRKAETEALSYSRSS